MLIKRSIHWKMLPKTFKAFINVPLNHWRQRVWRTCPSCFFLQPASSNRLAFVRPWQIADMPWGLRAENSSNKALTNGLPPTALNEVAKPKNPIVHLKRVECGSWMTMTNYKKTAAIWETFRHMYLFGLVRWLFGIFSVNFTHRFSNVIEE